MAENKKSVVLYCDIIHTVEKLDNETAGKLFKHYLRYVNDLNPTTDDTIVSIDTQGKFRAITELSDSGFILFWSYFGSYIKFFF